MTNYWVRQDMILPPMLKKNIAMGMVSYGVSGSLEFCGAGLLIDLRITNDHYSVCASYRL